MNELALFAGAGGGILGGKLLGWRTVCAVEYAPYPRSVLLARQRDGLLPHFPIWDDVRTFDGNPWRGRVDVISGGFPCQDISPAGKGVGITGERSGLWKEFKRIIGEVQPKRVLVENSSALIIRGIGVVLGDLAELGYDAKWGIISSADAGAEHERARAWIVAYPTEIGRKDSQGVQGIVSVQKRYKRPPGSYPAYLFDGPRRPVNGDFSYRKHYELASGVDRLEAIGNGQDPRVVRLAWELLNE